MISYIKLKLRYYKGTQNTKCYVVRILDNKENKLLFFCDNFFKFLISSNMYNVVSHISNQILFIHSTVKHKYYDVHINNRLRNQNELKDMLFEI